MRYFYKYTGSDQSINLCVLRDSCHELFSIFGIRDAGCRGNKISDLSFQCTCKLFCTCIHCVMRYKIARHGMADCCPKDFGKKAIWITWVFLALIQDGLRKQPKVCVWIDVWGMGAEIPNWWLVTPEFQVVLLIGLAAREICVNQSKAQHRSRYSVMALVWNFLYSFLWYHFVGKPVLALQNVSCFLRISTRQNCCPVA